MNDANLTQPNEIHDSRSPTTLRDIQNYKPVLYLELYMPRAEPYNIEINLYFTVNILLKRGNHLHDLLISLGCDICTYKTSFTSPLFIEVPVSSHDNGVSCLCVLDNRGIDLAYRSCLLLGMSIGFWNCSDKVRFMFVIHFYCISTKVKRKMLFVANYAVTILLS